MKVKDIFKIICTAILSILFLAVIVLGGSHIMRQLALSEPQIIQIAESPDGKYVAYVFESNAGATTDFTYRLSILKSGKKLSKDIGNTFISGYDFDIYWEDAHTLKVNNTTSIKIFKQKTKMYDVDVKYRYLKEEY